MLDRDGGQVRIRREVSTDSEPCKQPGEDLEVRGAGARLEDLHHRSVEPGTDEADGSLHRQRRVEDGGMGHDPDETAADRPWDSDRDASVEQTFPPSLGRGVLRSVPVVGLDEEVDVRDDVRDDHRRPEALPTKASVSS